MQGFLTTDFAARYEEAIAALAGWIREGKLRYREDMLHVSMAFENGVNLATSCARRD